MIASRMFPQANTPVGTGAAPAAVAVIQGSSQVSTRAGHHIWDINGTRFEIPVYYQPVKLIGQGAYGIVM